MRRLAPEDGQSTVEVLGLLPLGVAVLLVAAQALAAGAAREAASEAAQAGAMALLQGGDPAAAARHAAPGWSHARLRVRVTGRVVRVRVRPAAILPGTADLLEARSEADAGPAS